MKVAVDARKLFDGGVGTYLRGLITACAAKPSEFEFVALVDPKDQSRVGWKNVREAQVVAGKYGLAEHFAVPSAARRAGAELLHEPHYTLPIGWSGSAVVTVHDLTHLRFPHFFPPGAALYARAMAGYAVARAQRVIVDSEDTRIDVLERLGADPDRVRVVHLGVSPAFVRPAAEEIEKFRKVRELPRDYLLYVGARKRHKNLGLLIEALARIPESERPLLVLAGRHLAPEDPLVRAAEKRGVRKWIDNCPLFVDSDFGLATLYAGAALYVQPSLAEGFGLPPLEAMACGTPVISSNAGSLPEVLGDAAVLLPPDGSEAADAWAGAIRHVLGDSSQRSHMTDAGVAQAARFTWERAAEQTLATYREALESAGSGASGLPGKARALAGKPIVANSVALVVLRGSNLAIRLGLLFLIARAVPPASFGILVFALSVAEIGKVLADFGTDTLAIRGFAVENDPEVHRDQAASLAGTKLVLSGAVFIALAVWLGMSQPAEGAAIGWILAATVLTAPLVNLPIDWFQARLQIRNVLPAVLVVHALLALVALFVIPRVHDLRTLALAFPAVELATGLVLFGALRGEAHGLGPTGLDFAALPTLVRRGLPIAATAFLVMAYSRLDVLVLSRTLDPATVAYYGIAFRITEPFQIVAASFGLSVFSRFTMWFRDSAGFLRTSATRYLAATFAYGLVCAALLLLVAPPLIARLLPAYEPAVPILRLLAIALVFRTVNATLAGILQGAGRFRLLTGIAAWNLVLVFALLALFVPRFGAPGAALALLLAEALNTAVQTAFVFRTIGAIPRTVRA